MISKKTFYLWGLFPPEDAEYLSFIMDLVQSKLTSPFFEPHIILAGPYLNIDKTFVFKLKTFGQCNSLIILNADGYFLKKKCLNHFIFQ